MAIKFHRIIEHRHPTHPEWRTGRHVKHDDRSRNYPIRALVNESLQPATKVWTRHVPAFNQGDIGSCTGNAECGLLMTEPFFTPTRNLKEADAVDLYSLATHIDPVDGQSYPPNDTGSSGLDICQAAIQKGYISAFHHGFTLQEIFQYLSQVGPVILGMNWYDSFDKPDSRGVISISPSAGVRGGHETEIAEIHVEDTLVGVWNSWGPDWGDGGKFYLSFDTFGQLMSEDGDVTASVA